MDNGIYSVGTTDVIYILLDAVLTTKIKQMKKYILKLNHLLFPWYYKNVDEHFSGWTLFKSIDILGQNYRHQQWLIDRHEKEIKEFCRLADKERKMRLDLQMKMIASDEQIEWANKTFGLGNSKSEDN